MAVEQNVTPPPTPTPKVLHQSKTPTHPKRIYHRKKPIKQKDTIDTVLVVNPNSASGLTGKGWNDLYSEIKGVLGASVKVALTKKAGDGTTLTRQFLKQGFKKVVAIGGDGTLNEVANGFFEEPVGIHSNKINGGRAAAEFPPFKPINPDAIMGVVPAGTRNVLAKSLGLPEGVANCCRAFQLGKPKKIDVIYATVTSQEDHSSTTSRIFLNAAEMGVAGEIIERSKKVRQVVNSRIVSTIASIAATLPTYQSNECEISIGTNGKKFATIKLTMAVVANGQFLGGGFKVAPHASMSDGFLDLVILKDSGSLKMIDELINMKDGDYSEEDNITYRQTMKVSLISKERDVTVTADGEPIGILPATFEVIPHALTVKM
jgi:diacylglycerol kinase (ATP)